MWRDHFKYLKGQVNDSGQIVDPFLNSPLNFQYHYTAFLLSSILLDDFDEIGQRVLKYFLDLPMSATRTSSEFNNFFLLTALNHVNAKKLQDVKGLIHERILHRSDIEISGLNYNFRFLRLLNLLLEQQVFKVDNGERIDCEMAWALTNQFDDGIFPDSQITREKDKNEGVPHLVYHAKICMVMSLIWQVTKNEKARDAFLRGLEVFACLNIDDLNYGRSTNSLFGYASLYLATKMAFLATGREYFQIWGLRILEKVTKLRQSDGLLLINQSTEAEKRPGYDSYMYSIVYNCYANAIFLLADSYKDEQPKNINLIAKSDNKSLKHKPKFLKESGFVNFSSETGSYLFNIRGHQDSYKHRFDPRVSPFSLISWKKDGSELLPGMGYAPQPLHHQVEKRPVKQNLRSNYFKLKNYSWLPLLSGNNFFYRRNWIRYYPEKPEKIIHVNGHFFARFKARSRGLAGKNNREDRFIIHIEPGNGRISISLQWYEAVDALYYAFRRRPGSDDLSYEFDREMSILSPLIFATSNGICQLDRMKANSLKKIKFIIFEK